MTPEHEYPEKVAVADLSTEIRKLITGVTDPTVSYGLNDDPYGKCVEAMWRAAYIAFEAVAGELGVTGFQGSVAALTVLGKLNRIEGPYMISDFSQALYPQYDIVARLQEALESDDTRKWLAEAAAEKLARYEGREGFVNGDLCAHWQALVDNAPAEIEKES